MSSPELERMAERAKGSVAPARDDLVEELVEAMHDAIDNGEGRLYERGARLALERAGLALVRASEREGLLSTLKAIVDCYGIAETAEELCDHLQPFIEQARAALSKAGEP